MVLVGFGWKAYTEEVRSGMEEVVIFPTEASSRLSSLQYFSLYPGAPQFRFEEILFFADLFINLDFLQVWFDGLQFSFHWKLDQLWRRVNFHIFGLSFHSRSCRISCILMEMVLIGGRFSRTFAFSLDMSQGSSTILVKFNTWILSKVND